MLRRARESLLSPTGSGRPMSRQELADAVSKHAPHPVDYEYISRLERGEVRWPAVSTRYALRVVLGAWEDHELGFYITRPANMLPATPTPADAFSNRMISKWEHAGAAIEPSPDNQAALDHSLRQAPAHEPVPAGPVAPPANEQRPAHRGRGGLPAQVPRGPGAAGDAPPGDPTASLNRPWTGVETRALRLSRRMSVREFAHHLGVSDRMVSKWEHAGRETQPRAVNQAALDYSLRQASADQQARFGAYLRHVFLSATARA